MAPNDTISPLGPHAHKSVVVVTTSDDLRANLVRLLESWGHETLAVGTVDEAVSVVDSEGTALVVLDTGFDWPASVDVADRITESWPGVPTVVIVPSPIKEIHGAVQAEHLIAILHRPFEASRLKRLMAELLEGEPHAP